MNVPRAFLAAVGAFWSELIPAPSLWDYEGSALADREAEIDSWEPDGLLGREPSHADFDDEPPVRGCALCNAPLGETAAASQLVPGMFCSVRCVELAQAAVTVPAVTADPAEVSAGVETTAPSAGLPFTFNAGELIATATELISQHYRHNTGRPIARASEAAELVVSQLVADLTAAYAEAQK